MTVGTQVEMVAIEMTGEEETTPTTAELLVGTGATGVLVGYGTETGTELTDGLAVATTGKVVLETTVERAGQLVTVAAQEVMVTSKVE